MEGIDIRPIQLDELKSFFRVVSRAIGFPMPSDERLEHTRKAFDVSRSLAAYDRDQIVGTAHALAFEWTVPGGVQVPAGGVTAVSVAATHRRRGILSRMMRRQLEDVREHGDPVAILLASESVIYGRFGYGLATTIQETEIDPRVVRIAGGVEGSGRVRFVTDDETDKIFPAVYDRWRRSQHGAIDRSPHWWESQTIERKPGDRICVVYENPTGEPEGYAAYRVQMRWDAGLPDHQLGLQELTVVTPDAYAALWNHVLGVDLVSKIETWTRPTDEPLRWMLTDPRRLRARRVGDFLWARILDVPRMLSARSYAASGRLVLHVSDPLFPDVAGRYELEVSARGAECVATTAEPDVELGIADLGAVYQGGTTFSNLARTPRIVERAPGALARADLLFSTPTQPWSNTGF